jgi:hypothetical protein
VRQASWPFGQEEELDEGAEDEECESAIEIVENAELDEDERIEGAQEFIEEFYMLFSLSGLIGGGRGRDCFVCSHVIVVSAVWKWVICRDGGGRVHGEGIIGYGRAGSNPAALKERRIMSDT